MQIKRIGIALVCLLLVCCLIVNISPIRAKATGLEPVVIGTVAVEAAKVILPVLAACGIMAGVQTDFFEDVVNNCVTAMTELGHVVNGCIDVLVSAGKSYVGEDVIQAVMDWVWANDLVTSDPVATLLSSVVGQFGSYSIDVKCENSSDVVALCAVRFIDLSGAAGSNYVNYLYAISTSNVRFTCSKNGGAAFAYNTNQQADNFYYTSLGNAANDSVAAVSGDIAVLDYGNCVSVSSGLELFYSSDPFAGGISTTLDIALGDVAAPDLDLAVGYAGWASNAIQVEDTTSSTGFSTLYPISISGDSEEIVPLSQTEAQAGTYTGAATDTETDTDVGVGSGTGTVTDATVAATPWATFTEWVADKFAGVVSAVTAIPAAVTDFFTFDTNVEAWAVDLTDFFPFCIPFDIYDFLSILAAEPEAPVFHWEIPVPQLGQTFELEVDLSAWDDVAKLFRSLELLAFIVGLAYVTREKFIRG